MALLIVKDVHTFYGSSEVLRGVSLEVQQGRIVCLLGRNGMGKSTLLRSIVGLTPPKQGAITFNGKRIESLKPDRIFDLGIGYVPQGRRVFPYLTVEENLRLGLRNKGEKRPAIFEELFEILPILADRLRQKAGTLSGGEQQMLVIARALAGKAKLLLVDEPTEGIQPTIVDEILKLLARMNESGGLTILLVEQNMELAWIPMLVF
ncbi:branched-chain amino acid transport system ATP-binding protein [Candidatus Hakubella thermalkaliphila]|uniref:Branched-chain amino acid transport system ATP-binding protein n=2 Tax=Candidatus Hakubella thermalkaliphila TaxID=2754717 RepID=A0A6V8P8W0_9ACTN|nr:ABC transporter ATP-binding protein [Candidatus Hakubella thermalkaliphila]GFP28737.1 branched-chain amino acid transport system ATP-binding protein [Candidatus Hakubella thermalkaliphila]GFP35807.1 branched-chain amino acid transport system ATP-binding protein [Candidatus Hakubella thermalkaliphila]